MQCKTNELFNFIQGSEITGESSYDIWKRMTGIDSESEFLDFLRSGPQGEQGLPGETGKSVYEEWLTISGNEGKTFEEFLETIKGTKGDQGATGKSAYEQWLAVEGNENKSVEEFLESLKGEDGRQGVDGKSAYQIWLDHGNTGTEEDFLNETKESVKADLTQYIDEELAGVNSYTDEKVSAEVTAREEAITNLTGTLNSHSSNTTVHITEEERNTLTDVNSKKHEHTNKAVLDNTTASFTTELENKLSNISEDANKYVLPEAGSILGGVKSGGDVTIASGVITVNDDSHNHVISNVDGLQDALDSKSDLSHTHDSRYYTESETDAKLDLKLDTSLKGTSNGLAELDENGKVPSSQLPSYVDDVLEGAATGIVKDDTTGSVTATGFILSGESTECTPESGKIYIDVTTSIQFRWSGSVYVTTGSNIALGETSSTAYRGDRGKIAYDHSQEVHARTDATKVEKSTTNGNVLINGTETNVYTHPSGTNPHGTTKSDVGLGNVPNVTTNDQTPSYTEATTLAKLTSGEKLSVAFGKISKAITDLISHIADSVKHITSTERTNWNAAKTHADSAHAPSNAEKNQNAFSNVVVGSTTVAADTATDSLTLVAGSNVTITPDATNDKITIAATDTKYTHPTTSGNKHIPSGGSSGQILRWSADGTAAWGADNNTTYSAGTGISLSGTTFSNSGVRSIATGGTNGTISVNTNGTSANVAVKGLAAAAYKAVDTTPKSGSANVITSGAVYSAIMVDYSQIQFDTTEII